MDTSVPEGQYAVGTRSDSDIQVEGHGIEGRHFQMRLYPGGIDLEPLEGAVVAEGMEVEGRASLLLPLNLQVGGVRIRVEGPPAMVVAFVEPEEEVDPFGDETKSFSVDGSEGGLGGETVAFSASGEGVGGDDFFGGDTGSFLADGKTGVFGGETGVFSSGGGGAVAKPPSGNRLAGGVPGAVTVAEVFQSKQATHVEYDLDMEIARGGMGRIYKASDSGLQREVAVKVSSGAGDHINKRLVREAEVLAGLAHPNIVPVYAMGWDEKQRPFYSMKLIHGSSLQAILNDIRKGVNDAAEKYPLPRLLSIFSRVCDAMSFAHSKKILHRDLKPENVMIGQYGEVLLMDWGLAKVIGEAGEVKQESAQPGGVKKSQPADLAVTMEGEVVGSPKYMSPEQSMGRSWELDERCDVYSLGAMLYAILTLRPPVEARTLEELLEKIRNGRIDPMEGSTRQGKGIGGRLQSVKLDMPDSLQAIVLKAMAVDPAKRYQRVTELQADLEAFRSGFVTRAEQAGFVRRIGLWIRRNRALAASVAVLGAFGALAAAKILDEGQRASRALKELKETAPTFAQRAKDALRAGDLEDALKAASFAVKLEPGTAEFHVLRGEVLQILFRLPEALEQFRLAPKSKTSLENMELTERLMEIVQRKGEPAARAALLEVLNAQGRNLEGISLASSLGDYWKEKKRDPRPLRDLLKALEPKMMPVPGHKILLSKTEITQGEWKLYLKSEGQSVWTTSAEQDQFPMINLPWQDAQNFCVWLSKMTGKNWRLPSNKEWGAAAGEGRMVYPWNGDWPPKWNEGNYAVDSEGGADPKQIGADGIHGVAPVMSFRPNALGFYDLGGNVAEWVQDGPLPSGKRICRGASWMDNDPKMLEVGFEFQIPANTRDSVTGMRIAVDLEPPKPPTQNK